MTNKEKEYAFVLDDEGKQLDSTTIQKAWILIRKNKAKLVSKYPIIIQLCRTISSDDINKDEIRCGINDGGLHVGIALVQKCKSKNKVLFKGTIEQRNDVKKLMETRKGHRNYRRQHKRYREARFDNRSSSKRKVRIAPSILQKRQAILRIVARLRKWVRVDTYYLSDTMLNVRALTDGYKPYSWQYQKSNRLDENLRKATILRDKCKCQMCGKANTVLEAHHITPKRNNGADTIHNLITLCSKCHNKITGTEEQYASNFYQIIQSKGNPQYLNYASHVMIGKNYLRSELEKLGELHLVNGGDMANKRIDWDIPKTDSNDAMCAAALYLDSYEIKEWTIKPMRRQSKAKTEVVLGIHHRDLVSYTYRNGETHTGYVTALYPHLLALNFQSPTKHCKKVNATKCRLIWKYSKIYWLDNVV